MGVSWSPDVTSPPAPPQTPPLPSHVVPSLGVFPVSLPFTNPGFSLSASTPLSYCLARWLPRYFSTCLSWSSCMPDPSACCRGLPFPDGCFSLPSFSEWDDCLEMLASMQQWYTRLCFAGLCAGLDKTSPCSWIWKMFGLEGTTNGLFGFLFVCFFRSW